LPDIGKSAGADAGDKPTGRARFYNLFFSPGVTDFNQPTSVISSLPSGARSLYLFFDYENMAKSMALEMKVSINGREASDWGLPSGPWGGGEQGSWWVGWKDAEFTDGSYTLALYVDGAKMGEAQIAIGGPPRNTPSFSNVVLGDAATDSGAVRTPSILFPAGTKTIYAAFDYDSMTDGMEWTRSWLVDGQVGLTKDEGWNSGRSGTYTLELTSQRGLDAGAYRLNLHVDGELAALSNFWVTGGAGSGAAFEPITFAEGIDRSGNPVGAARTFSSGLEELHAFSDYSGMEDGMSFVVSWYIDGEKVIEDPWDWDDGEEGPWHYYLWSDSGSLPDGKYDLELDVEGQVVQTGSTTVGTGARPTPEPTDGPKDGVQIQGNITDLDTGRAIPGAIFLVLNPGISLNTFQWTDDEVYTSDDADRNGFYQLPRALKRGECYTMIIGAEGYWPYGEDDVCVGQTAPAVLELPVRLEKK
jgi:hypothetical protein